MITENLNVSLLFVFFFNLPEPGRLPCYHRDSRCLTLLTAAFDFLRSMSHLFTCNGLFDSTAKQLRVYRVTSIYGDDSF